MNYVYIMTAGRIHKVGFSANPQERVTYVRSPNRARVVLRRFWEVTPESRQRGEVLAHWLLHEHLLPGHQEWFRCPYVQVEKAVEEAVAHVNAGGYVPKVRPKNVRRAMTPRRPKWLYQAAVIQAEQINTLAEKYSHVR